MHHDIDGREGSNLYDWHVTRDYCKKVAAELGIEIRFSWLKGGFEGELYKQDAPKAAIRFELPGGTIGETGGKGKPATRRRHPAKAASLTSRWCSAVLKIDVGAAAIRNDPAFNDGGSYLVVTGERREESSGRATYAEIEAHRTNCASRDVTQWRAVIDMGEQEVWDLIREFGLRPHPCYELGFGRCSCAFCIFASPDQLASLRDLMPERFQRHADIEVELGHTVDAKLSLPEMADKGTSFVADKAAELRELAQRETFDASIAVDPNEWTLPAGAFGDSAGPV
jgi:3'-phosphoadenosine 5'-phosphosulfate sulfotransferase (PAPS reductase)/FAD synthetase